MRLAAAIERQGTSPPIVLLHSLALDRTMWGSTVDALDDDRTVITMDLRGHGESPPSHDFTIEDIADDVASTLAELGFERAVIVGLSMGGCVAQAVAIRHPQMVSGLGLIDTTAWYGPDAPERWAERAAKAREAGMLSLSQFQLDRWFGAEFLDANRSRAEALLEVFAANDLDSYVAACYAMGAFDARPGLGAIDVPTVVIVGELDPATSPDHAAALHEQIAGSTLHVIPGAKHLTPVEVPEKVADLLRPLWSD